MKRLTMRLFLSMSASLLLIIFGVLLLNVLRPDNVQAYGPPNSEKLAPHASFHFWAVNEIFSCEDGSEQFVELATSSNNQQFLAGREIRATNSDTAQTHSFFFPQNSGAPTQNKFLLIATAGFSSLPGGITPDFTLPPGFLFTDGSEGEVQLIGGIFPAISYAAGGLPLDGVTSLGPEGSTSTNSPRNFAGQTGSVSCATTPNPNLTISKQAPATIEPFGQIAYTLTVTSSGTLSNTNVVLTDTVPISTSVISASVTPINGVLTWTLGDMLPPLSVTSRTFVVTTTATTGTIIVNSGYGVRSDQTSATGAPVTVLVPASTIYLPVILK